MTLLLNRLQLRIDNEFVASERELDLEQNDVTNMRYTGQQDITDRSVNVPFGFFQWALCFFTLICTHSLDFCIV